MHGRPLTTTDYSVAFSSAEDFIKHQNYWPHLHQSYKKYNENPDYFMSRSVSFLDGEYAPSVTLNNLPLPDYEDTGFVPRPQLERELKKKLLGRHPVVTVLGEGGSGKSALALQTLYGMIDANDHDFDAIVWFSAKSSKLSVHEITRIEGAIADSLELFEEIADQLEPGDGDSLSRIRDLLSSNKILLVIDNLENIIDDRIKKFAEDVPGESKILFTPRVPLGHDLSVHVGDFAEGEARGFLKRLAESYGIPSIRRMNANTISRYMKKIGHKPLMLKWFALGVHSGLDPDKITANPKVALTFCIENIVEYLGADAKSVAIVISSIPNSCSAAVISHISGMDPLRVEAAI
ncbi:NB-ARC domain-containing protein [Brevundimonas sp. BH3]|uniref:NB-ARC domain-containing protein n=1 Tax=Brevundimonas sp. BH3 TaxID=3133089 RepID=UPI0032479418